MLVTKSAQISAQLDAILVVQGQTTAAVKLLPTAAQLSTVLSNQALILAALSTLQKENPGIMSALTDLQTGVTALSASVSAEIAAATAALQASIAANAGSVAPADAETVVNQLTALKATLDAETAALAPPTGTAPTPTPTPTPGP